MKNLWMLPIACVILSCSPSKEVLLRPQGESASIHLRDGRIVEGELLALQDSLFVMSPSGVEAIDQQTVQSLKIHIEGSRNWLASVIILQGIPSTVLMLAVEEKIYGAIGLAATALTWASFELSQPRVVFEQPWNEKDIDDLRSYMRYPFMLTDKQLSVLKNLPSQ